MAQITVQPSEIEQALLEAAGMSRGHFRYESGHHGDLWLDLDGLFVDTRRVQGWASALAQKVQTCQPDVVGGPLTGGAFVAQLLAAEIGAGFVFSERLVSPAGQVKYRIPETLRLMLSGKRVLLVDDAVNAGSALQSTWDDLQNCGAELAGFASLLALGGAELQLAKKYGVPFFTLAWLARTLWTPEKCPLCRSATPLVDPLAR